MIWQVFSRPVGFFGCAAIFMILVALCQMNLSLEGPSPLYWAIYLLILEFLRQIVVFYYGQAPNRVDDVPVPKWKSRLLCLLSFAVPPIGFVSWLALDSKTPVVARRVGRAAVRGTLVLGIIGYVVTLNWLVNTAVYAIELARIEPYNQARIDKMRMDKKKQQNLRSRQVTLPIPPKF